jgi:hypothetical protein
MTQTFSPPLTDPAGATFIPSRTGAPYPPSRMEGGQWKRDRPPDPVLLGAGGVWLYVSIRGLQSDLPAAALGACGVSTACAVIGRWRIVGSDTW